ncbi:MAG TPA: phytoene/squalene synthase family protein [Pyrinomonadaceae bacterium]|nr:phytoene/squalene synthase family protein [Pyrinomonadaceae bacterium]
MNLAESNYKEIENAYKYCESVTKKHAKSFYFAAKFLPKQKQKPIYALYALCRSVDDEVDEAEVSSEADAIKAIELWKEKLNEIYLGENKTENQTPDEQNLVLVAWQNLLQTYKIPQNLPLELMKGVLQDTHVKRYETFDELYVYCWRVASTVGLMSSEIFGYEKPETLEYAEALGIAMQLTNILRDVKEDALMGRIYLPQEDLRRFNVSEEQIFAGEINQNFVELIKFQIKRAREYYEKSYKGIALLERDTRFTVLFALRIYSRILGEIERQNYDVFQKRAHTSFRQKVFSIPKIWLEARNF